MEGQCYQGRPVPPALLNRPVSLGKQDATAVFLYRTASSRHDVPTPSQGTDFRGSILARPMHWRFSSIRGCGWWENGVELPQSAPLLEGLARRWPSRPRLVDSQCGGVRVGSCTRDSRNAGRNGGASCGGTREDITIRNGRQGNPGQREMEQTLVRHRVDTKGQLFAAGKIISDEKTSRHLAGREYSESERWALVRHQPTRGSLSLLWIARQR
ncbi:hypothetical protein VTK73DRAFT_9795 [Phialemonium thermophilum]|uniref:Uncharacterized protein n=1 Tax=Phialemonium thermophilum TaxID=223376 RepID=A0ABR3W0B8_9PEZI